MSIGLTVLNRTKPSSVQNNETRQFLKSKTVIAHLLFGRELTADNCYSSVYKNSVTMICLSTYSKFHLSRWKHGSGPWRVGSLKHNRHLLTHSLVYDAYTASKSNTRTSIVSFHFVFLCFYTSDWETRYHWAKTS